MADNLNTDNMDDLSSQFFIDLTPDPAAIPVPSSPSQNTQNVPSEPSSSTLLLPSHVSVFGSLPVVKLPSPLPPPEGEEDYIEFLDYGGPDGKGQTRYFETQEEEQPVAPTVVICKRCNARGEHKTINCPVIICLTCGARNEHTTHSCPISKVCFSCGMKGHINVNCPNRGQRYNDDKYDDCHRCGSSQHSTNECPTLWRLYDYLTEAARNAILEQRRAKKLLSLGEGGEGYIAEDVWCYNCGGSGHWGDDCKVLPHNGDIPSEYSAFSSHNLFSGPFADFDADRASTTRRELRDWEREDYWGDRVPTNVGRKGKKKEMAHLQASANAREEEDTDNWFERPKKQPPAGPRGGHDRANAKMKVSIPKSLQDRLSDGARRPDEMPRRRSDKHFEKEEILDNHRNRGSNGGYRRQSGPRTESLLQRMDLPESTRRSENRPRYRGGYNR